MGNGTSVSNGNTFPTWKVIASVLASLLLIVLTFAIGTTTARIDKVETKIEQREAHDLIVDTCIVSMRKDLRYLVKSMDEVKEAVKEK